MKGRIDESGYLWMERAGLMRPSLCPIFHGKSGQINCGDWCALFQEPEYKPEIGKTVILTCQAVQAFINFKDDRRTE